MFSHSAWASNYSLDIVVALDASTNVQSSEWSLIQSFLSGYVEGFRISPFSTRFGFLRYSSSATVLYDMFQTQTTAAVQAAIAGFQQQASSSSRNLADAFQLALSKMFLTGKRDYAERVSQI